MLGDERDATLRRHLLRDRDVIYAEVFRCRLKGLNIREVLATAPKFVAERGRLTPDRLGPA
jgi:hypothetical protein